MSDASSLCVSKITLFNLTSDIGILIKMEDLGTSDCGTVNSSDQQN